MTRTRPLRAVRVAADESAPILPGGFEAPGAVSWSARSLDAFLAELDAGGEPPDAVLAGDGARVAAVLRRHEACAELPIFVIGPEGAPPPPGCDAVLPGWTAWADERARAQPAQPPLAEPLRDSERRVLHFARWMSRRGHASATDAAAFGVDAPVSLLSAWEREAKVVREADGRWRALPALAAPPSPEPPLEPPSATAERATPAVLRDAAPSVVSARPRRPVMWSLLLLAFVALAAVQGGGWLGTRAPRPEARDARARLVVGGDEARREAAPPPSAADSPAPASPPAEAAWSFATAAVETVLEEVVAPLDGVLRQLRPAGGGFAPGAEFGRIAPAPADDPAAEARRLEAARERARVAEERYERRRSLAVEGVLAWREVAPDWEELEAARAALALLEQAPPPPETAERTAVLRAARAGAGLSWLVAQDASVRAGEAVARYETGDVRLVVRFAAGEAPPAIGARVEARGFGGAPEWQPLLRVADEVAPDGVVSCRFLLPGALHRGSAPPVAELRWPARG